MVPGSGYDWRRGSRALVPILPHMKLELTTNDYYSILAIHLIITSFGYHILRYIR